jgi:hypothetical protein
VLYEYEGLDRCFALILLVLLSRSFIIRHELFLSVLLDAARNFKRIFLKNRSLYFNITRILIRYDNSEMKAILVFFVFYFLFFK